MPSGDQFDDFDVPDQCPACGGDVVLTMRPVDEGGGTHHVCDDCGGIVAVGDSRG